MIKDLNLEQQQLTSFPEINIQMYQLRFLNLSSNNIRIIPLGIQQLNFLEYLNLNRNLIYKFPQIYLPHLHTLEIASNQLTITEFPKLKLQKLNIAYNPFEQYYHNSQLKTIVLSWFILIDMCSEQNNLFENNIGEILRKYKLFTFIQFVNAFTNYYDSILIKAIQYDEKAIISNICNNYPQSILKFYHPQPLILAIKLNNIKIFEIMLNHLEQSNTSFRLFKFLLFWTCNRFEVQFVELLINKIYNSCLWDEKMYTITQNVGSKINAQQGDTPLHLIMRKKCRTEEDYLNQEKLIQLLNQYKDIKNNIGYYPVHEILLVPSLRTFNYCKGFNLQKRCGKQKDSLLHQAVQQGNVKALEFLSQSISMFIINKLNKTPKQKSTPSIIMIKYLRKLEQYELHKYFHQQKHLCVSQRNFADFQISITGEDDLYQLLQNENIILQDKLFIVVLLNMLQFKQLHNVYFVSERSVRPIQYINQCKHTFKPDIKSFKILLQDCLQQNKSILEKPYKQQEIQIKRMNMSTSISLDPIRDTSNDLYNILTLYQSIGINGNIFSNRTTLLDYEDFHQQQFRQAKFQISMSKKYIASRSPSPLPKLYNYQNYITFRRKKSNTIDPDINHSDIKLRQMNYTIRKKQYQI